MFDLTAQKLGIRILAVDRPGLGGTPNVDLECRIQTWLEIVPALLSHLQLQHVALVSHSAGTIYLINTLLHLRHVLHPSQPYVAMVAPWVHHSNSSSMLMSLTNMAPCSTIGNFHSLSSFLMTSIMPSVGPMFHFSGNMASRIGAAFPFTSSSTQPDASTYVMQPGTASEQEHHTEKKFLAEHRTKYVMAECISGGSQEALLCLKRPVNHWGAWDNYDKVVPLLAHNEKLFASLGDTLGSSRPRRNLCVDVFYAEHDKLTNGQKGSGWFDQCWNKEARGQFIDYMSGDVLGQTHETVIDPDLVGGPIEYIFMKVAKLFQASRETTRDHTPIANHRTSFYLP